MPKKPATAPFEPLRATLPTVTPPAKLPASIDDLTALLTTQRETHQAVLQATVETLTENITQSLTESITQSITAALTAQFTQRFHERVQQMLEQIALHRHRLFGTSSERSSGQGCLFDEADTLAASSSEVSDLAPMAAPTAPAPPPSTQAARGKRSPLPPELPRIDVVHDVAEADRSCPCGCTMTLIGQDISEQLDIVPLQVRVLRHIRLRYGCAGRTHAPVTAALPAQPLPKSNASANLLAMLLTVKFVDGLPLTRFHKSLLRHGATVPTPTLARWVIGSSQLLQPLFNLARDTLLDSTVIHMDETVVQVLKEPDKKASSTSYMWVQSGGPPGKNVVLYDYDASRSGEVPVRLLQGWRGYLMTDGYDGYNRLARQEGIEHLACWAHVRRRFVDAVKVQSKGRRGLADEGVRLIGQLYSLEREHKASTEAERLAARQQRSVPVLAQIRQWLDKTRPGVVPKSALGMALSYLDDYWGKLVRYTERGDLPIDNNRCENAIRPFVIGRKAWLFSDTTAGAQASAVIYSLVETAKANGLEPYSWLRRVMRDLPRAKSLEDMEALLPWNLHAVDLINDALA